MNRVIQTIIVLTLCFFASVHAAEPTPQTSKSLDEQVLSLKKSVLALNRELFILEEELLFPGNTQVSVFLSMDVGAYFKLDTVELRIDDKELTHYLYTEREIKALRRGGTQRLYLGNQKSGMHELVVLFTGSGPKERDYKRGATIEFEKGVGPKFIELKIVDNEATQQPDFKVREWE